MPRARSLEAICEDLEMDLCFARLRHLAARRRLGHEDTPGTRAAEAECRAQLDVVLDLLGELRRYASRRGYSAWPAP